VPFHIKGVCEVAGKVKRHNPRLRSLVSSHPLVGVLGGSKSDFPILEKAVAVLSELGIANELMVVSAHRTPDRLFAYAEQAPSRGIEVIIAGAGGAAHLPGMLAAKTHLPVIGVPIPTENLRGLDSLLSIVQMPRGIPVATVAIGGAENAGLLAAQILAGRYPEIADRVKAFRTTQTRTVLQSPEAKGSIGGPQDSSRRRS
jgi:phosphoribosylaminoimidazole carboxylase PurE protein